MSSKKSKGKRPREPSCEEDEVAPSFTQQATSDAPNQTDLSDIEWRQYVPQVVRYMLFCQASNTPIRQADVDTKLLQKLRRGMKPAIWAEAKKQLKDVFGYEVDYIKKHGESAEKKSKTTQSHAILKSCLELEDQRLIDAITPAPRKEDSLLLVILSLILLESTYRVESNLLKQLKNMGVKHTEVFEDTYKTLKDWLDQFVKQNYLKRNRIGPEDREYLIGDRATHEIGIPAILKFAANIMDVEIDNEIIGAYDSEAVEAEEGGGASPVATPSTAA